MASASTSSAGRSPRSRSRAKSAGMVTTNWTSPRVEQPVDLGLAVGDARRCGSSRCSPAPPTKLRVKSLSSSASTAVGRCFGSVLIAKPNSSSCMIGMPTIIAKVSRSRRIWTNSLTIIAHRREQGEPAAAHAQLSRALLHQVDEHVLERRRRSRCQVSPGAPRKGAIAASSAAPSVPLTCSVAPNGATISTPGCAAQRPRHARRRPCRSAYQVTRPEPRDHLGDRCPAVEQLAVGDVGEAVAALGLVHVVRGDQHGEPVGGEPVDLVPELAPRLGVDAGGGLVEQQQLGLVQDRRRPAPGAASSRRRARRRAGPGGRVRPSRSSASSHRARGAGPCA